MKYTVFFLLLLTALYPSTAAYPDNHIVVNHEQLSQKIIVNSGMKFSFNADGLILDDDATYGYVIFAVDSAEHPFNRGLPSWNGMVSDDDCGFRVLMRFPYGDDWSPWLTVGFWQEYIWNSYGLITYAGGKIDIDYVKLYEYQSKWQFRVEMKRPSTANPSPILNKLSFFVSDSRSDDVNHDDLLADKPAEIFVPTDFLYQYGLDPEIGGSICSPTSVAMILKSYDIAVDALQFARDTQDPYYGLFGVWPRVVQNAAEYGLDGTVMRYRSWSATREVLANGGRIAISVGPPLYQGHLMMLAGFTADGDPIVHDPAKTYGYAHVYDKLELAKSWFDKGGISYTFYPGDNSPAAIQTPAGSMAAVTGDFELEQNYPNPFNPTTTINFTVPGPTAVRIVVYDLTGKLIEILYNGRAQSGSYSIHWDARDLATGSYFISLQAAHFRKTIKATLVR